MHPFCCRRCCLIMVRVLKPESVDVAELGLGAFRPGKHNMPMAPVLYRGARGMVVQMPRVGKVFESSYERSGEGLDLAFSLRACEEFGAFVRSVEEQLRAAAGEAMDGRSFCSRVGGSNVLRVVVPAPSECRVYNERNERATFEKFMEEIQGHVEVQALLEIHHAWYKGNICGVTLFVRALQYFPQHGFDLGEGYPFL